MEIIETFQKVAREFKKKGYNLYLIGGSTRDYLLHRPFFECDCATDATPIAMTKIIPNGDYKNQFFGNVNIIIDGIPFEITTFRNEDEYQDLRHPRKITFTKDMQEDYQRRDFSINAIYMDMDLHLYCFERNKEDLENHLIKSIKDASFKIRQYSLRIVSAIRFKVELDFNFDDDLETAIKSNINLINMIKKTKLEAEINKAKKENQEKIRLYIDSLLGNK